MTRLSAPTGPLPIDVLLSQIIEALRSSPAAVVTAPAGAGKTTRVPLALLESGLAGQGQIVLLQPRRLATRAVARMMARSLGQPVGRAVGYRVRFEDHSCAETRILVVTEGILTRRLLADPVLEGVGCVILDEFHERSLHADLALAFLRELLQVRDDLKLVVMSATLEAGPICRFLDDCPHLRCETRQHPLTIEQMAPPDNLLARGKPESLGRAVRKSLHRLITAAEDDGGDLLVFLPGAPEIERVQTHLEREGLPGRPLLLPLHGGLSAEEQDRALAPNEHGRRVVLATNIAETSLTVPGVTTVVDSGLVKQMRFDPALGLDRLELTRISQSSATQRAGRAGRLGPGRALRLWSAAEHAGLRPSDPPEIQRLDLAPALLAVLSFRPRCDPARFEFFEPPPPAGLDSALELLGMLGALAPDHRLTDVGRRLASLPVPPRVGAMLERGGGRGALVAAIVAERDLLRRDTELPTVGSDLAHRAELLLELERGGMRRADARRLGVDLGAALAVRQARDQLLRAVNAAREAGSLSRSAGRVRETDTEDLRRMVLTGFPDRVCRRREAGSDEAVMVGGHGVRLAHESGVREAELFVAVRAEAPRRGTHACSLVRLASAVTLKDLEATFPRLLRSEEQTVYDDKRDRVVGLRRRMFADLVLQQEEGAPLDVQLAAVELGRVAARRFDDVFRPDEQVRQRLARLRLAAIHLRGSGWPDASPTGLRALLPELCAGCRSLEQVRRLDWAGLLERRLDHEQRQQLQQLPERIQVPSGRSVPVDYAAAFEAGGTPVLSVKLQELFGLADTPVILQGRLPLTLHLLAPNGRPVQVTRDLRSFWNETYHQVRKDLRGRYPKHPWPEDPWSAQPTAQSGRRRKG